MKKIKSLGILPITLIAISCASTLPKKPKVEVCVIYAEEQEASCVDGESNQRRVSIHQMDRAIALPPIDWAEYQSWVDLIWEYAKRARACEE